MRRVPRGGGSAAEAAAEELPFATAAVVGRAAAPDKRSIFASDFQDLISPALAIPSEHYFVSAVSSSSQSLQPPVSMQVPSATAGQGEVSAQPAGPAGPSPLDLLAAAAAHAPTQTPPQHCSDEQLLASMLADLRLGKEAQTPAPTAAGPGAAVQLAVTLLPSPAALKQAYAHVDPGVPTVFLLPRLALGALGGTSFSKTHPARFLGGIHTGGSSAPLLIAGSGILGPFITGQYAEVMPVYAAGSAADDRQSPPSQPQVHRCRSAYTLTVPAESEDAHGTSPPAAGTSAAAPLQLGIAGSNFASEQEVTLGGGVGGVALGFTLQLFSWNDVAHDGGGLLGSTPPLATGQPPLITVVLADDAAAEELKAGASAQQESLPPHIQTLMAVASRGLLLCAGGKRLLAVSPSCPKGLWGKEGAYGGVTLHTALIAK